ncbi:MAG: phosphatidylglycerol lysyltransferase domain-containing protein [Thermodesulfobacteriota bacterium]
MEPVPFKELEFEDKAVFDKHLREDPPLISELTFTNLFIWRHKYHPVWQVREGCLLVVVRPEGENPFAFFPVGAGDKIKALNLLWGELERRFGDARICRVDEEMAGRYATEGRYDLEEDRNNSDYVYLTQDLIHLPGNKFHRKKNHLNQFLKNHVFEYRSLDAELVECFLDMQEAWCRMRECVEHPALLSEDYAIREALTRFEDLGLRGGAIVMAGKVEAFSLGEPLNEETAVIHVEKANPDIPGIYAAINQLFCQHAWSHMKYVNREQDLGVEGLRKAKESYHPHHMVRKYTLVLR